MLKELYIRRYKNLVAVRVPIADRVVVYGENGVGKTSLLEALALVAGSEFTTHQMARRVVPPEPGAIEVVTALAGQATAMPWTADKEAIRAWWVAIGVDEAPESWQSGIEASSLPDEVKGAVADPSSCALRYSLVAIDGLESLRAYDRGVGWREEEDEPLPVLRRRFDTTLCVPRSRGDVLRSLEVPLPEVARPLGAETVDPDPGEWVDVLVMPPSSQAPFLVSWLASERSDDDLWADCSIAVGAATAAFRRLTTAAQEVLDLVNWPEEVPDESGFLANKLLSDHAVAAIRSITPNLELDPAFYADGGIALTVDNAGKRLCLGGPGDESWISRLSSGERVLVDEALLDALEQLNRDSFVATISRFFIESARTRFIGGDDSLLGLQQEIAETFDIVNGSEFWTDEDLRRLLSWTARMFEEIAGYSMPNGRLPVVRLFDEPERHLHPFAQQRLAEVLHGRDQEQIVVASHSAPFLGLREWEHLSLKRTRDGVHPEKVDPTNLNLTNDFARRMGLRPGDLLNLYRYVLIVEGAHDEAFLDGYAGSQLRSWGVLILRMHGVDEAMQVADLEVVKRLYLPLGTLIDHGRTKAGTPRKSKESELLDEALHLAKSRGQGFDDFRLERPDIIAYISDDVLREEAPRFPGFRAVEDRWKRERGSNYKQMASEMAGGYTFNANSIRELASKTAATRKSTPRDLADVLANLEVAAGRGPWLPFRTT